MTQEQKDLLLKNLCARLSYGVKISVNDKIESLQGINVLDNVVEYDSCLSSDIEEVKLYLYPLSSMTEEQKYDFYCRFIENDCDFNDFKEFYLENNEWHKMLTSIDDIEEIIDWFNKYHFDFRCLIPKGLAIDATNKNIY
jgi:hypothetical protein